MGVGKESIYSKVVDLITRIRMVEESLENVMKRITSFEIGTVKELEEIRKGIQDVRSKISSLEERVNIINNELEILKERLKDFAVKEDIRLLEKYIEFLKPTSYVTEEKVREIIKEMLGDLNVLWKKEEKERGRGI